MVENVEDGPSSTGTILIEERPDGKPGQVLVIKDDGNDASQVDLMRTFRVVSLLNPGGRIGVTTPDGKIEIGLNAGFYTPQDQFPLLGSYVKIAPISGEVGRRIYAHGAVFWGFNVTLTEIGVGYRHITEDNAWEKRFWFVELSIMEQVNGTANTPCTQTGCDKGSSVTPVVTVGYTWK